MQYLVHKTIEFTHGNRERRLDPGEHLGAEEIGDLDLRRFEADGAVKAADREAVATSQQPPAPPPPVPETNAPAPRTNAGPGKAGKAGK